MTPTALINQDLVELRQLVRGADSIERKLTLPDHSCRSAAAALGVDPLEAQIRQVFCFDTPDLALNRAGVMARAQRVPGRDLVELSTKCLPGRGLDVAIELRELLASKGIPLDVEQTTETKTALEFFSAELREAAAPPPAAPVGRRRSTAG